MFLIGIFLGNKRARNAFSLSSDVTNVFVFFFERKWFVCGVFANKMVIIVHYFGLAVFYLAKLFYFCNQSQIFFCHFFYFFCRIKIKYNLTHCKYVKTVFLLKKSVFDDYTINCLYLFGVKSCKKRAQLQKIPCLKCKNCVFKCLLCSNS